jgi:serine/threonine-protein kinase
VEGETLQERIDREKQLPVEEAIKITTDLAEALDYAHRHNVIHRDIKPANILMHEGRPLIADFGIALAVGAAGGGRLTETGLSLGTPFYMSPEQATGDQHVGPPGDIYALAAVLYEMLTGDPPYIGSTAQAVLGKIIQGAPVSATEIREAVPVNVDAAIRKALEKLPADRFTGAQDFARALADPGFRHGELAGAEVSTGVGPWQRISIGLGATTLVLAVALSWTILRAPPPNPVERFTMPYEVGSRPPALSPDGSALVFHATDESGQSQLWVRRLADLTLRPISGTEGRANVTVSSPAFSPDGEEVAFVVGQALRVSSLEGGGVRTLADSVYCCPRWESDGFLYFSGAGLNIDRVPATGGSIEPVTQFEAGDGPHSDFNLLPGGEVGVFSVWGEAPRVEAIRLATGERRVVVPGMRPYVTPWGHLIFASVAGQILAAAFDAEMMELTDAPITLVENVTVSGTPYANYGVSASGTLVYRQGEGSLVSQLVWMTRSGDESPVDPEWTLELVTGGNFGWRLSPDDTRLAISLRTEGADEIWIKVMPDGPLSRLTFDPAKDMMPRWKPDGETITFAARRAGELDLWSKRADGVGQAELLVDLEPGIALGVWSADGEWLVLRAAGRAGFLGARDILAMRPGVDTVPSSLVASGYSEQGPALSPSGRWLAYSSDETGRDEVFVRPFPDVAGGKWQVSTEGGIRPLWAHSGEELFFVNPESREMMVAEIQAASGFQWETRMLFRFPSGYRMATNSDFYDIDLADQRFLMARAYSEDEDGAARAELVLVQNWFEELRARVPN